MYWYCIYMTIRYYCWIQNPRKMIALLLALICLIFEIWKELVSVYFSRLQNPKVIFPIKFSVRAWKQLFIPFKQVNFDLSKCVFSTHWIKIFQFLHISSLAMRIIQLTLSAATVIGIAFIIPLSKSRRPILQLSGWIGPQESSAHWCRT